MNCICGSNRVELHVDHGAVCAACLIPWQPAPPLPTWTRIDSDDMTTFPQEGESVWVELPDASAGPDGTYVTHLYWHETPWAEIALRWTSAPIPKPPEEG